jgi:hypothetical protein
MNAKPRLITLLSIAAMFIVTSVAAVAADDFPGSKPDRRILKTQEKVDELFEKGDYERAYFIYREELVPLGDKYAQYMVGYMNIVGKGVERDYIAGSAWYRLAAERGHEQFSKARDEVWELFNDEQRLQSDKKYAELRLKFSDAIIVANLVEVDLDIMEQKRPNSRMSYEPPESFLTADTASLDIAERARVDTQRTEIIADRISDRLDYLRNTLASGRPMAAAEIEYIREVERRAQSVIN